MGNSSHRAPEATRDSQINVILVEDRPIDAELVVLELEREGLSPEWVRVQSATALIDALDTPVDLVLSDWSMPGFTGLDALEIVRSHAGDLPFILVSGSIGEEAAIDALHRGADDYIFKDRMGRLGPAVRRALRGREERATHHRIDLEWRRLSEAIEQAHDAVVITDTEPQILYVNPAFERITGYTREEAVGQNPRIVQSGSHPPSFYQAMWATLTSGESWVAEFTNRRKDGSLYYMRSNISPIRGEDGSIASFVSVAHDVTHERELEADATRLARERALIRDTLARLPAAGSAEARAEGICRQVVSLSGLVAVAVVLFDHEGLATPIAMVTADGEAQSAQRLNRTRSQHLRARALEGPWVEAFSAGMTEPYGAVHARLGTTALAEVPIRHAGALVGMLAAFAPGPDSVALLTETLPALADFAGLSGILVGPAIAERTSVGRVRGRITAIIDEGAFHPVFQPIVDLATHDIVGFEALTRFDSGERPDLVFAEAWSASLGPDLEIATLRAAVEASMALPPGRWLSVNLSPGLLAARPDVGHLLAAAGRPIVAEITEHEVVPDYDRLRAAVQGIGPGTRLAVDDAGAGVANFAHILGLRAQFVKLDIGLVRDINRDVGRQALMVGMQHFARASGCRLIAEGIETQAEADTVTALGAEFGQGYLFGRPEAIGARSADTSGEVKGASDPD